MKKNKKGSSIFIDTFSKIFSFYLISFILIGIIYSFIDEPSSSLTIVRIFNFASAIIIFSFFPACIIIPLIVTGAKERKMYVEFKNKYSEDEYKNITDRIYKNKMNEILGNTYEAMENKEFRNIIKGLGIRKFRYAILSNYLFSLKKENKIYDIGNVEVAFSDTDNNLEGYIDKINGIIIYSDIDDENEVIICKDSYSQKEIFNTFFLRENKYNGYVILSHNNISDVIKYYNMIDSINSNFENNFIIIIKNKKISICDNCGMLLKPSYKNLMYEKEYEELIDNKFNEINNVIDKLF